MHDSTNCPICHGLPGPDSLSDEDFYRFVESCRAELVNKQEAFTPRFEKNADWQYDLFKGTLTIEGQVFPVIAVGSHSGEHDTWLWAWANENLPKSARESSEQIKQLYDRTGFRIFDDAGADATVGDAEDLAAMALHQLDGVGLFLSTEEGSTLYLAVFDPE